MYTVYTISTSDYCFDKRVLVDMKVNFNKELFACTITYVILWYNTEKRNGGKNGAEVPIAP